MANLTTLEAIKNWLAIPDAQTGSDGILSDLAGSVSDDFLRAIEREDFLAASYTEAREGDGNCRISTRHWPINSISAITVAGVGLSPSSNNVAAGYYIDTGFDPERLNQIYLAGGEVFTDLAPVSIAYNAGYATVPDDVAQAVTEWAAARFRARPEATISTQRSASGEHATFDKDAAMPANTARVIEKYKRCWPSLNKRDDDRDYRVTRINRTYTETVK